MWVSYCYSKERCQITIVKLSNHVQLLSENKENDTSTVIYNISVYANNLWIS